MSHEVETMAWAHQVPWHGLGVKVGPDTTPAEMLVAAGLDWKVEKRPLFTTLQAEGGNDDIEFTAGTERLAGKTALVRQTDGRIFDVVGERWNPVQNAEVLEFFTHFCKDGGATMETAGALKGGQIVWGLANLGNGFILPGGDAVKGYLLLASKHEAGYATIARVTPIRVVCANTFALSGGFAGDAQVRVPHTRKFNPEDAANAIGLARQGISEFEQNAKLLTKLNISRDDAIRLLAPIYQSKDEPEDIVKNFDDRANRTVKGIIEAALKSPGSDVTGSTAWDLFNGVTYYANHMARGTNDNRFASTLVGQNNVHANKVFGKLLELAA